MSLHVTEGTEDNPATGVSLPPAMIERKSSPVIHVLSFMLCTLTLWDSAGSYPITYRMKAGNSPCIGCMSMRKTHSHSQSIY